MGFRTWSPKVVGVSLCKFPSLSESPVHSRRLACLQTPILQQYLAPSLRLRKWSDLMNIFMGAVTVTAGPRAVTPASKSLLSGFPLWIPDLFSQPLIPLALPSLPYFKVLSSCAPLPPPRCVRLPLINPEPLKTQDHLTREVGPGQAGVRTEFERLGPLPASELVSPARGSVSLYTKAHTESSKTRGWEKPVVLCGCLTIDSMAFSIKGLRPRLGFGSGQDLDASLAYFHLHPSLSLLPLSFPSTIHPWDWTQDCFCSFCLPGSAG